MSLINSQFSPYKEVISFTSYGNLALWAVGMPLWGALSDRFSRKWVSAICLGTFALDSFLMFFAWEMWVFVILNLILGLVACGIPAVTMRILFEILPPSTRGIAVVCGYYY